MNTTQQVKPEFKQILDYAAVAAVIARRERVERTQISKLLEMFESNATREGIEILKMFILRQTQRREIGLHTAKVLLEALSKINDPEKVRNFLTYFKWLYEALEICYGRLPPGRNYEEVINHIMFNCLTK